MAVMDDLPQLKNMYGQIITKMNEDNIQIWDEVYPCEFFAGDIENKHLYVLEEADEIVSAFCFCNSNAGAEHVQWSGTHGEAFYIDRFGVHVKHLKKGIGSAMLTKAVALAKARGGKYLRLFVVDINEPAINLYIKNGFKRVDGVYEERVDEDLVLREFGFEIEIL